MLKIDRMISNYFGKNLSIKELIKEEFEEKIDMQNENVEPFVVNLNEYKNKLDEGILSAFGSVVQTILNRMFGQGDDIPIKIKGTKSEIESFAKVLNSEKKYIDAWHRFGLDDPRVHQNKYVLDAAIIKFENETGIKWPFGS